MRFGRSALISVWIVGAAVPMMAFTHARRGPTSPKLFNKRPVKAKQIGQRAIDDQRATQIQTALARSGYLTGTPSGHWDEPTEAAMTKLQADNGWQTKLVPDSRGLIKLGLGPNGDTASRDSASNEGAALGTASANIFAQR